jgi:hypothetical protein
LDKYPRKFIDVLSLKEKYDFKNIFENLKSPVNDGFNLAKIKKNVEAIKLKNPIKREIIRRINIALNKNKIP